MKSLMFLLLVGSSFLGYSQIPHHSFFFNFSDSIGVIKDTSEAFEVELLSPEYIQWITSSFIDIVASNRENCLDMNTEEEYCEFALTYWEGSVRFGQTIRTDFWQLYWLDDIR